MFKTNLGFFFSSITGKMHFFVVHVVTSSYKGINFFCFESFAGTGGSVKESQLAFEGS